MSGHSTQLLPPRNGSKTISVTLTITIRAHLLCVDFLLKHNSGAPHNVRVVTDTVRVEDVDDGLGKTSHTLAGKRITRYIRDRLQNIPVLVRTKHKNIETTEFVSDIWLAGSTEEYRVAQDYIDQLAGTAKHNCDVHWSKYDAH